MIIYLEKNIYLFENNSIELNNINQNELSFKNYLIYRKFTINRLDYFQ